MAKTTPSPATLDGWLNDLKLLSGRLSELQLDDTVAWQLHAIAAKNDRLRADNPWFLDMVWFGYVHRTALRIRAMTDHNPKSLSYVNLLKAMMDAPALLLEAGGDLPADGPAALGRWENEFVSAAEPVRLFVNKEVAHWNRDGSDALQFTQLRRAVHEAARLHQRVHRCLTGSHLHYMPEAPNWMSVLEYPWWPEHADPSEMNAVLMASDLEMLAAAHKWPTEFWP